VSKKPLRQRSVRLEKSYHQYLQDERAADFIAAVAEDYSIETLKRLAQGGKRVLRRAAMLALGFLGDYDANEVMGRGLRDRDRAVRLLAEHGLRQVWFRAGNPRQYQTLNQLVRLNDNGLYHEVLSLVAPLLAEAPTLAEAWNQRAIAQFSLCEFEDSVADCQRALEINPYHYNAAMGLGHCHLQLEEPESALDAFRTALQINPNLECVRSQIRQLERAQNRGRRDD
jgi:tetratricopeptide (TPR) repeat protein